MSVRLCSLEFEPRSDAESPWTSGVLQFGRFLTFVNGDNGSGKTPLMRGLAFALGHALELPPAVVANCSALALTLEAEGERVIVRRTLGVPFEIEVVEGDSGPVSFRGEKEFSEWVLELFGVPSRALTSKQKQETIAYASIWLPIFYVNQDTGWNAEYGPPANKRFVEDQSEELVRLALGVPAKHPFRGSEAETLRREIRILETSIDSHRGMLEKRRTDEELELQRDVHELAQVCAELQAKLAHAQSGLGAIESSTRPLDEQLEACRARVRELERAVAQFGRERDRLERMSAELGAEIDILSTNEVATSAFQRFCGNENCGLFRSREQTSGKQLLYLKDQLKDLVSTNGTMADEIRHRQEELGSARARRRDLEEAKRKLLSEAGHSSTVALIQDLTKQLVRAETALRRRRSYEKDRTRLDQMISQHQAKTTQLAALQGRTRGDTEEVQDASRLLSSLAKQWLDVLGTRNISNVEVDRAFRLFLDGQRFSDSSHHSGSTRTRIVLAYHAALLEASLQRGGHHPPCLILDAPRQHELHTRDIKAYVAALRELSARYGNGIQIVLAASELDLELSANDVAWVPGFEGPEGPHYLGAPMARA